MIKPGGISDEAITKEGILEKMKDKGNGGPGRPARNRFKEMLRIKVDLWSLPIVRVQSEDFCPCRRGKYGRA